ncbi:MAG TPA: PaaI family thioesterase [Candidatus Limnocylindrales bacterium]|jgi:acyl-coenzyme A thioesterase PaaI-like protein|nr:PaaI family thioesterase [Candidatus Limnocylindrales bacterium]
MDEQQSLQERYAARSICFGCGPANAEGLRMRSLVGTGDEVGSVVAEWTPQPRHQAFEGVLNGGIIGTLMDCHSNWTAAHHLMERRGAERPPTTVTAEFAVRLLRPTPIDGPVRLRARVVESGERRATVEAELLAGGEVTATCRATFVAVSEGHPAYDRW